MSGESGNPLLGAHTQMRHDSVVTKYYTCLNGREQGNKGVRVNPGRGGKDWECFGARID